MPVDDDTGLRRAGEVLITVDGAPLDWRASLAVRNHSPTNPAWGYGGSGSAQLALAILLMVTDETTAERFYQRSRLRKAWPAEGLRPRRERGSPADGTQRSQDDSDRHCGRGAGAAGVHGALPACDEGKHTRRDAAHFLHEPFQFTVVLDPLPVKAEFVFGELQADGFSAGLPRPVVVGAVAGIRVVMAAAGGRPTGYTAGLDAALADERRPLVVSP